MGWDTDEITLIECQLLVNRILKRVVVKDGRGRKSGCADKFHQTISLPKWARKKWYVLHECAHFLSSDRHGPIFVSEYIKLLSQYYGKSIEQMKMSLKDRGIKYV